MNNNALIMGIFLAVIIGWVPGLMIGFMIAIIFPNKISWVIGFIIGILLMLKFGYKYEIDKINKEKKESY
jgi:purine-cytosine permease-like protein